MYVCGCTQVKDVITSAMINYLNDAVANIVTIMNVEMILKSQKCVDSKT